MFTPSRKPPRPFPRTPLTSIPSPSSASLPRRYLVRRRICGVGFSSRPLHHFAVLPDDHRKFQRAVLGLDVFGGAAQGAFSAQHKSRRLGGFVLGMSVGFHG